MKPLPKGFMARAAEIGPVNERDIRNNLLCFSPFGISSRLKHTIWRALRWPSDPLPSYAVGLSSGA